MGLRGLTAAKPRELLNTMRQIQVNTAKPYRVVIADDYAALAANLDLGNARVAIVSDDHVAPLYADAVSAALGCRPVHRLVVPAGEGSKSMACYASLLEQLAALGFGRHDTVLALGGGVVGDLAGFVASTYMRGVGLVAVPTSLLAMVDSSVGGKTAINLQVGKNLCGTFYQPDLVYIATGCCATLPAREVQCGWGEIIKYSFLADTIGLADLEGDITPELVEKCVRIKADIVSADEREGGQRKLLNFGHTVGHAIERLAGFALSHGECVVKGMYAALSMSARYYDLPDSVYRAGLRRLAVRGHDLDIPYSVDQLMQPIMLDKKGSADGVDAILVDADLRAHIVPLTYAQMAQLLQ